MGSSDERPVVADDRLRALPDGLLHTVLSFLTARQAVQTSVLSRWWEDLWCSMPCLNIDDLEFHASAMRSGTECSDTEVEDDPDCARFEDFVSNLLMFHSALTLDRFRFHAVRRHQIKVVDRWIRRGIKRCPKVVEIHSKSRLYGLPHLGSSSSRLNRLHLVGIALDGTFTHQLRSGCPALEDLELKRCSLDDAEIASCTLKNLIIEDCTTNFGNVLTIKAPSVAYLQLVIMAAGWNWADVIVNEVLSLIKATIRLESHYLARSILPKLPCKLLCNLINVKILKLSGFKHW